MGSLPLVGVFQCSDVIWNEHKTSGINISPCTSLCMGVGTRVLFKHALRCRSAVGVSSFPDLAHTSGAWRKAKKNDKY